MISITEKLPNTVSEFQKIVLSFADREKRYQNQINVLEEQVRFLKNKLFGSKSEKLSQENLDQLCLFDEAEATASETPSKESADEDIHVPGHSRKKKGRKPLPEQLPRVEVIHDLEDEEKECGCGNSMSRIGEDVSEKLDIIPAQIQVIRNIRYKYACKVCEGVESDEGTVKIAPVPAQLIPKGIATSGLLAYLISSKFVDALPFYRQEKIFDRIGVNISRATMCGWAIKVANQCAPLTNLLRQEILSGPLINIDETPLQVLNEPGRKSTTKSYMWIFRGGPPGSPSLIYQYSQSRSGNIPEDFLEDYSGYVQTDAFSGYNRLSLKEGIILVGCWAHVRRKFAEVISARKSDNKNSSRTGSADKAMAYIGKLYAIEKLARAENLSAEQIYQVRQEKSKPILKEFKLWLDKKYGQTPPQGLLGKAIAYALNHWDKLVRYLDNGFITPDNNMAENAIRPFVVGRKNWLFSGNPAGAQASATLYTLIETAKANGLEPYHYLKFLFDKLPLINTENEKECKSLLPQYLDKKLIRTQ
jgi:transposase